MKASRLNKKAPKRPVSKPAKNRVNRYRGNRSKSSRTKSRTSIFPAVFGAMWRTTKVLFSGVFVLASLSVLSLGLILGYHYILNAEYFLVRKVVLGGIERVSRETVLNKTGLNKPTNIIGLRLDKMGAGLRALPWVEEAKLTRKLPDTIIITIKEREPRALISLGEIYYLDEKGTAFKKLDPKEIPYMPIITGLTRADLVDRKEHTRKDLKEVFALMDVLSERNDRFRVSNISEINFDPVRGISMFTRDDNVQVKIGLGEYEKKMKRLGRVLAHLKINGRCQGLTYFNLECSPRVVVRHAASS